MYSVNDDKDTMKGMCLHLMFSMINEACKKFNPDCLIACRDGNKSWRKEYYPMYKANRVDKLQDRTPSEIEKQEELKELFENEFLSFINDKTNIPMLSESMAEADDLIAHFIQLHPDDVCIILSTDNDFVQLLNDNVFIYNSMEDRLITSKAILDAKTNKPLQFVLKEGKVSVPKDQPKEVQELVPYNDWVEYALFMKCVRGDKSDNIFSAYPGVREKSTKNKVGIRDAFLDRKTQGYNWTTFMNSSWEDAFGNKHIVKEEYEKNKNIIDLNDNKNQELDDAIMRTLTTKKNNKVGIELEKFFNKWNLEMMKRNLSSFSKYYQQGY
jgi:5'-3' exonuclease